MKIETKFIDILAEKKFGTVGDIIEIMGFLKTEEGEFKTTEGGKVENLPEHYELLERIFWTVDFLKDNELIDFTGRNRLDPIGQNPDFSPIGFVSKKYIYERIKHIVSLLKEYWNAEVKIKLAIYDFIDKGYKTDKQLEQRRHIWVPITVAIIVSFLTATLTAISIKIINCSPK